MFFQCRQKQRSMPIYTKPTCMKSGCDKKVLECDSRARGEVLLSLHCKHHACRERLGEIMCPNPKDLASSRFCSDHRRCQAEGCDLPRKFADFSSTFAYCQKHTCFIEACHLKRVGASTMCAVHTPICLIPDCTRPRSATGYYCISHSCTNKDCDNVINGSSWCSDHKMCSVPDCPEARVVTADGGPELDEGVCHKHLRTDGETRCFCSAHECAVPSCRETKMDTKSSTELYCWHHRPNTCRHTYCTNSTTHSNFCSAHGCASLACLERRGLDSAYCSLHGCVAPGCPSPRTPESPCCIVHSTILLQIPKPGTGRSNDASSESPGDSYRYATPAEETLARRLREERERLRRDRDLRQWRDGVPFGTQPPSEGRFVNTPDRMYWGPPYGQSLRRGRDEQVRRDSRGQSQDSGIGSSAWGSDRTFVS